MFFSLGEWIVRIKSRTLHRLLCLVSVGLCPFPCLAFDAPAADPFAKVLPAGTGPLVTALIFFAVIYVFWILPLYWMNNRVKVEDASFWNFLTAVGGLATVLSYLLVTRKGAGEHVVRVKDDAGESLELMQTTGEAFSSGTIKKSDKGQLGVMAEILRKAIVERATDIHLEPTEGGLRVRFRVDGILHEHRMFDVREGRSLVSCVKVLASIDVAEKRKAQDGSFRARRVGEEYDLRAASSSSVYGEKIVLRILPRKPKDISADTLGMGEDQLKGLRRLIVKPTGMIIITGPTGSGKTTTLYALLKELDVTKKNIITVEDPVEYHLNGITQIQVQKKAGVTFTSSLESILRQDPDILMIGEVRDMETAEMAMRASLTGHLVLTTLHTNDAPQTVVRLLNMGIEAYLISAAVKGILSQRLVRRLCTTCRTQISADEEERDLMKDVPGFDGRIWTPGGCNRCRDTGYYGRTGIFELLIVDEEVSSVITSQPSLQAILEVARRKHMRSLRQDGLLKAAEGETCLAEVVRVAD